MAEPPSTDEQCADCLTFPAIYVNNGVECALDSLDVVSSAQTDDPDQDIMATSCMRGKRGRIVYQDDREDDSMCKFRRGNPDPCLLIPIPRPAAVTYRPPRLPLLSNGQSTPKSVEFVGRLWQLK